MISLKIYIKISRIT